MLNYEFAGLPLHILLVHFVVIAVPLGALRLVLATVWPAARRRLGVVTPIIALLALIAVPLTTEAGEWLEERVPLTPLVAAHAALGTTLLPWSAATFVVALLHWVWFRFGSARMPAKAARITLTVILAIAVAAAAVGSVVTVVQIGDAGARAVWTGKFTQDPK